jgi:putative Holliday junction resolvase
VSGAAGTPRRLLAVDYGATRTGLAATDWTGAICLPLPRLVERDEPKLLRAIAALARERETQAIVVGMPLLVDGSAGERARRTAAFVARLAAVVDPIPVSTVDESHTTDEAHERLKQGGLKAARRKELADSIAALLILERYRAQQP